MRLRGLVTALVVATAVGGAAQTGAAGTVGETARSLLAPAYDAVTVSSMRNLAMALQSYTLLEDGAVGVTVEELAGYGWVPQDTTAVVIHADDAGFRAVARDVRPGAGTFEVAWHEDQASVQVSAADCGERCGLPAEAGVVVVP